jgi:DNA-binding NarL/FixJ family response regulator
MPQTVYTSSVAGLGAAHPIRCLVADGQPVILQAVTELLESGGFEVVAQAGDGEEALAKIKSMTPAIAVIALVMPQLSGIEVARIVGDQTAIVLFTRHGDQALLTEAIDAGVRAYVLKEASPASLLRAVETVAAGGTYIDPGLADTVVQAAAKLAALTKREREVLRLLADGKSNEEAGKALFIAPETVRTYIQRAMQKLDADTRTQAVATALRQQLIA